MIANFMNLQRTQREVQAADCGQILIWLLRGNGDAEDKVGKFRYRF
jgi:hypothetical protein